MEDNNHPITDWSETGRIKYIQDNEFLVELIISQACDLFGEQEISHYFKEQDKVVDWIINQFKSSQFNYEKLPKGLPKDINLFSELNFWFKYKTGKSKISAAPLVELKDEHIENAIQQSDFESDIDILVKHLEQFNELVASDIITYWLMANKKLLDELSFKSDSADEVSTSNSQKTRYKADAAFRYLYFFLGFKENLGAFSDYEEKYLVKGDNSPQYVAGGSETHQSKHKVRLTIKKIIKKFYDIHIETEDSSSLIRSLFKGIAKTSVLDVYEINKNDPDRSKYEKLLKSLKSKPSSEMKNEIK